MLLGFFLHKLSVNLSGCRSRSMECNTTSGLRFQIWTIVHPNLSMNFLRDLLSACHRLAKAAKVMRWDLLVAYCTLKHSTRVSKFSMDLGGSPPYQVNVAPLRDVGKTRHKIVLSLVYKFAWVKKASKCSYGFVVPSYRLRLSGFHPKSMSTFIMLSMKECRRVVRPARRCLWERLKSPGLLTVHWGCDSP